MLTEKLKFRFLTLKGIVWALLSDSLYMLYSQAAFFVCLFVFSFKAFTAIATIIFWKKDKLRMICLCHDAELGHPNYLSFMTQTMSFCSLFMVLK